MTGVSKVHDYSRYVAPVLGVITLGQSPRPDLERVFSQHAPEARVRVSGALDGMDRHEIADLARRRTDQPVLVRLMDGSTREIGVEWLHPLVMRIARELADEHARAAVVEHAGDFPQCTCDIPVVLPGRELPAALGEMSPGFKVGIVTSLERQARAAAAKWLAHGFLPAVTWATSARHGDVLRAAAVMREADVDVVLLDQLLYDDAFAAELSRRCGKRVVTTHELAAHAAAPFVAGR